MCVILVFVLITVLKSCNIEARVFCGDPNANNLTFIGYSCPVKCANVIAVVEQLKIVDYHRLLNEDREKLKASGFDIRFTKLRARQNETENAKRSTRRLFDEYSKTLTRKTVLNYLTKELKHYAYLDKLNKAYCQRTGNNSSNNLSNGLVIDQCSRRSPYENDFVRRLTRFLNSYAKRQFPFSKSLVVLLLRKILGTNMDLRQGELIVPKIMTYLRQALARTNQELTIVHLSPRHCLNIYVPGCYCKQGFLERTGQCVTLELCLQEGNKDLSSYLNRVVIH